MPCEVVRVYWEQPDYRVYIKVWSTGVEEYQLRMVHGEDCPHSKRKDNDG